MLVAGRRGDRPWRVGIRDPRGAPSALLGWVEPDTRAGPVSVSTSGDYERFFERGGVRYHHILDPRTGWPARGARAATVISRDATLGDALSTAVMVLGPEPGLAALGRWPGVEALVVDPRGERHATAGMNSLLRAP